MAKPKIYLRQEAAFDIDGYGRKELCTAYVLRNHVVIKLRKAPPKSQVIGWRRKQVKDGVHVNIAIVKREGPHGGHTVAPSLWYDVSKLLKYHDSTEELIKALFRKAYRKTPKDERPVECVEYYRKIKG